jgi:hypothetical protein
VYSICRWRRKKDVSLAERDFLVGYDYGMGGLWAIVTASSEDEITTRYPELGIAKRRPSWMPAGDYRRLMARERHHINDEPTGVLDVIVQDRHHE